MLRRAVPLALAVALAGAAAPPEPATPDSGAPAAPVAAASAAKPRPGAFSWFALPVIFWLPETRLGYGATGGIHFHLAGAPRTSSLFLVGAYTLNGQGSADVAGDVYLRNGMLLAGRVRLVHFPDAFYGLGSTSPKIGRAHV